jgi:hypothetical protein
MWRTNGRRTRDFGKRFKATVLRGDLPTTATASVVGQGRVIGVAACEVRRLKLVLPGYFAGTAASSRTRLPMRCCPR